LTVHAKKYQIEERRRQIGSMLAQSMTEQEIADRLGVDRTTISKDIKVLRRMSQTFIYDLAKSDLAFYYKQCLDTMQAAERIMWETIRNNKDLHAKERCQIAKIIIESAQARFSLFGDGPTVMKVKQMGDALVARRYDSEESS
jgi:IS30 family transposase